MGTTLEASVLAVGRCAEVRLVATGDGHDAVLSSALAALRSQLPNGASLEVSYASVQLLDCLRRTVLALEEELAGSIRSCEAFLAETKIEPAHAEAAATLLHDVASLQSATDSRASVLHALV